MSLQSEELRITASRKTHVENGIGLKKSHQPDIIWFMNTPQPFKLDVVHKEVSGLHQLVDLQKQLLLPLPVLLGLVFVCSTVTWKTQGVTVVFYVLFKIQHTSSSRRDLTESSFQTLYLTSEPTTVKLIVEDQGEFHPLETMNICRKSNFYPPDCCTDIVLSGTNAMSMLPSQEIKILQCKTVQSRNILVV